MYHGDERIYMYGAILRCMSGGALLMKRKKVLAAAISFMLAFTMLLECGAQAAAGATGKTTAGTTTQQDNKQTQQEPVSYKAKSVLLAEASTGKILYAKNEHEKLPPASITKIMTEILVLEAIEAGKLKLDQNITCSKHASSMGGSDIWLKEGEVMSVRDLFKAMAINSANDAAVALGEAVSGSEMAFVKQMNLKAKALGMKDTNFVNCTGLDADGHVTSAYDIYLMSRELIKHKEVFDYCTIWMDSLRGGKTNLYNTNTLIRFYKGANGLKTGSTSKAGYCVSATAKRDNMQLIAVTLGSDTSDERFDSARNLLDYGFANWSLVTPQLISKGLSVKVMHGQKNNVLAVPDSNPTVLVEKGKEKDVQQKISAVENVMAPVEKGQVLGQITLWIDGKNVGTIPLKAQQSVDKMRFIDAFGLFFIGLISSR